LVGTLCIATEKGALRFLLPSTADEVNMYSDCTLSLQRLVLVTHDDAIINS